MPIIKKQNANGRTVPKTGSVLDRIVTVDDIEGGLKICTYGRGKSGKTRLACSFPKPLLLLGLEDGRRTVVNVPGVDFVRIETSEEVTDLADYIAAGGKSYWKKDGKGGWVKLGERTGDPYVSSALDTGGGLQNLILKEVLGLEEIPATKTFAMAGRDQWQAVGTQFIERMTRLMDLADRNGLNVVVIAHERSFGEEGAGELLNPTIGPALTPAAAKWLNGACDYICQTFIQQQEVEVTSKVAGKDVTVLKKTGKKEYCLRTGPHELFMSGFRLPIGQTLPDVVVDPTYGKILRIINGEK